MSRLPDFEQIEKSLPYLVRERRRQQVMTLQELAGKSGLSTAYLSQLERGKNIPSLGSILKLADALDVDIDYFITPPEPGSLVNRADKPVAIQVDSPISYYQLDGAVKNKKLTAMLVDIPPYTVVPVARWGGVEEFIYVLVGEFYIELDEQELDLRAGDSIHLSSEIGLSAGNLTEFPTRVIWAGTPPITEMLKDYDAPAAGQA